MNGGVGDSRRNRFAARLRGLERTDKWFLTCGDGVMWAPPFPAALHRPGFWDEAMVYYHPFAPLFSVALISPSGNEMELEQKGRHWQPDRLTIHWESVDGFSLREDRAAYPGGRLESVWRVQGDSGWATDQLKDAHLVGYTAQPGETVTGLKRSANCPAIEWHRTLVDRHDEPLTVRAVLSPIGVPDDTKAACAALRSEGMAPLPRWNHTPFWELFRKPPHGGIPDDIRLEGVSDTGLIYAAIDIPLASCGTGRVGFAITLTAILENTGPVRGDVSQISPGSAEPWIEFLQAYPDFSCSDTQLSRYYDYRLYGLRLNTLAGNCGNVKYPAVAEGIGYFHVPITYSAQCHMWETRWSRDGSTARGSLLNFLHHQRLDGSLHGRIYTSHLKNTDFYHANWGDAVLAVAAVHEDEPFLARSYEGLARYADWLDRTRDKEQSGMYDIANHFETGQEYMSRYQAVDPNADTAGWQEDLRLKGIDITVYAYQLKRALGTLAGRIGRENEVGRWNAGAERSGSAILNEMWDEENGMFSDVDSRTMSRTNVKAAVCFYPLLTDLLSEDTVRRLLGHLNNACEFAAPYPVPSSSMDDRYFDAYAEWRGKRHNCPWNGRTWPMTNSHIVEGLIRQWHSGRRDVGAVAVDLLTRFVRMMFFDGDPARPNCFEHYNPHTGHPSMYRGIDDYQHSWVLDLLIRGVAGVEPRHDHVLIDPLPFGIKDVRLAAAMIRGRQIDVSRSGDVVEVSYDGRQYRTSLGTPLTIPHE